MKFNNISVDAVNTSAHHIKYKKCYDKEIIFRQFEKPEYFYGIIRGRVSIHNYVDPEAAFYKLNDKRIYGSSKTIVQQIASISDFPEMKEIFQMKSGQCFGHWGLLEKKERTATIISEGETDLFIIDKIGFELSFKVLI